MSWTYYWAHGGEAAQPRYQQFVENNCYIGCGPVAWTILFCWADRQAAVGNSYWSGRWGIYRQDGGYGGDVVAPIQQDNGVKNVIRELHNHVGTFCSFGQGATFPWSMAEAWRYLSGRTGAWMSANWNSVGVAEAWLRDWAVAAIRNRGVPAVIGTGWLSHYPVAFGYAWQQRIVRKCFIWCWDEVVYDRWFYVNQGWGPYHPHEWVAADTWFAGSVYP